MDARAVDSHLLSPRAKPRTPHRNICDRTAGREAPPNLRDALFGWVRVVMNDSLDSALCMQSMKWRSGRCKSSAFERAFDASEAGKCQSDVKIKAQCCRKLRAEVGRGEATWTRQTQASCR